MSERTRNVVGIVWCPVDGHRLALLERQGEHIIVTPEAVAVYGVDDRHRSHIVKGPAAGADSWVLQRTIPGDVAMLACRCGEFTYPEDLAAQVQAARGRVNITARRL